MKNTKNFNSGLAVIRRNLPRGKVDGFTLIELLVVIAIISLLGSIVLVGLRSARDKARMTHALSQIQQIEKGIFIFHMDTGTYPGVCALACNASNDPLLNSFGVHGWSGPYATLWSQNHPWGGHVDFFYGDINSDGIADAIIVLNDDRWGTDDADNSGMVPDSALQQIDQVLDDGNLQTGQIGTYPAFPAATGELYIRINNYTP